MQAPPKKKKKNMKRKLNEDPPAPGVTVEADSVQGAAGTGGEKKPKIIVLLDQARLETVKTRRGDFELLNAVSFFSFTFLSFSVACTA